MDKIATIILFGIGAFIYYYFFQKVGNIDKYDTLLTELNNKESQYSEFNNVEKIQFLNTIFKRINEKISCEISMGKTFKIPKVILTTNGNADAFSEVDSIVNLNYNRKVYDFVALRPKSKDYEKFVYDGYSLQVKNLSFVPIELPQGLGVKFIVEQEVSEDYRKFMESYGPMVIDFVIGERNFAESIFAYDFYFKDEISLNEKALPIEDLNDYIENRKNIKK